MWAFLALCLAGAGILLFTLVWRSAAWILLCVLAAVTLNPAAALFYLYFCDPHYITENEPFGTAACEMCGFMRAKTTHHCRRCGRCVAKFDHHCALLGTCIGRGNMCYLLKTLVGGVVSALTWLTVSLCYVAVDIQAEGDFKDLALLLALLSSAFGAVCLASGCILCFEFVCRNRSYIDLLHKLPCAVDRLESCRMNLGSRWLAPMLIPCARFRVDQTGGEC